MGNVNLPTPVALAGGAICVLGGYLLGAVAGPETSTRTTATVASYDEQSGRLCLTGDDVDEQAGVVEDGLLCGTWRRTVEGTTPQQGDRFRFVSMTGGGSSGDDPEHTPATIIYGDVVP